MSARPAKPAPRSVIVVDRDDLQRLALRAAYAAHDEIRQISTWNTDMTPIADRTVSLFIRELRRRQGPAFTKIAKPAIEVAATHAA
jgi:hypothetical protein